MVSCGNKVRVTGIEITSLPTKLNYVEGETFDPTGLEVKKIMSDETKIVITDYTLDKTVLSAGDTVVNVIYGDFTAPIIITVEPFVRKLADVEFKVQEGLKYTRTMNLADYVQYREVYNDGTYEAWADITSEDLVDYSIENGVLTVTASLIIKNKEWTKEFTVPVDDDYLTIDELFTKEVDGSTYLVNGILVAITSTMNRIEYILWNKDTNTFIGVNGLSGGGVIYEYTLETNGFEIGDELRIPVKLVRANTQENYSDSGKLYAQFAGGDILSTTIVSRNNVYETDKENVVVISNQQELIDFLSPENRVNNFYQVVKLHGKMRYIYYASSKHYRFFFDDNIKTLAAQLIDNCSPCFANGIQYYTTGNTIGEMLWNDENFAPTNWSSPASATKDIYALFIGGNTFYHEFAILSAADVEEVTPILQDTTFVSPTKVAYFVGDELDLRGAKVVYSYDYGNPEEVAVTPGMLDATTLPNMNQSGEYTVKGSYNGFEFSFVITVTDKTLTSVTLVGGLACALMILNYFGEDIKNTYNEVELVKLYEPLNGTEVYGNGTDSQGLKNLFNHIGYTVTTGYKESGSSTDDKIANFITWALLQLNQGRFIMVRYQDDREFGWHVIIGLDTMGTSFPRDDVLIMADPYDGFDHFQDGYITSAAGRFYRWWLNVELSGQTSNAFDCVVVYPKKKITIERVQEERKITQVIPDRHLLLNPDGSFGGTRDASKYGVITEKNGETDQLTSNYHAFVDYYNMESTDTRLILKGYRAFQQTMASSCGICSTLSVLNYYGLDVNIYDELFLTEKYCEVNDVATIYNVGVGATGLKKLVGSLGFVAEGRSYARDSFVNANSMLFPTYDKFINWVKTNLSKGTPMPISWRPHGGLWEVIIGYDNMGTDYIYDDVIVLADSHDTWDHYQDGYNTLPAALFYPQWYNGNFTYNQQYCIFDNKRV